MLHTLILSDYSQRLADRACTLIPLKDQTRQLLENLLLLRHGNRLELVHFLLFISQQDTRHFIFQLAGTTFH
jgi:hypothetical protein